MLALYSNPKWLSVVRGAVEQLSKTLGFPEMQCRSITRAVDEALTNIVRHSYGNRPDQPVAMYFRRTQRQLEGEVQQGLEILLLRPRSANRCKQTARALPRRNTTGRIGIAFNP